MTRRIPYNLFLLHLLSDRNYPAKRPSSSLGVSTMSRCSLSLNVVQRLKIG